MGNAIAFAQTQDGFLSKVGSALDRMSELAMLAQDETKTNADRALYDKEFTKLEEFITAINDKDFNGVSLFNATNRALLLELMELLLPPLRLRLRPIAP